MVQYVPSSSLSVDVGVGVGSAEEEIELLTVFTFHTLLFNELFKTV